MNKKIEDFLYFLQKNNIREDFEKYSCLTIERAFQYLGPKKVLVSSFSWDLTANGFDFWLNIHEKWMKFDI